MTEEGILKSRLTNIAKSVQKIAECPVCLETVKVPFKLCSRGHAVCTSCCEKLKKCPTCEGEFTTENPVCLKNLLEALPRLCEYSGDGCEEILEPGSDHKDLCCYRRVRCQVYRCEAQIPLVKLLHHFGYNHRDSYVYQNDSSPFSWPHFDPKVFKILHIPVVIDINNIFCIHLVNDIIDKHLKISFHPTPIGKMKSGVFARFKFKEGNVLVASTLKVATVSRLCETGENEIENDLDLEHVMRVPQSLLHKFVKKGHLRWEVTFFADSYL